MADYALLFNRLFSALPTFIEWMDDLLENNRHKAMPVIEFGFRKIDAVYPPNLRKASRIVTREDCIPLPPFREMGFHEFDELENLKAVGITYKDFIFLLDGHANEINCFHEMIHVVQWRQLGVEKFLLTYGMGVALNGYFESPLEQIAYDYQQRLESNALPMNFLEETRRQTANIWGGLNPLLHLSFDSE